MWAHCFRIPNKKIMKNLYHPLTSHELGSNKMLWFDEHNMTEEEKFSPKPRSLL